MRIRSMATMLRARRPVGGVTRMFDHDGVGEVSCVGCDRYQNEGLCNAGIEEGTQAQTEVSNSQGSNDS